ncbi:hypothetical protein ACFVYP_40655 [Kitasatospora sp. NPDC058201]|uniref:hypothetical protein n=1 Tax=unclassified Kitasatospora TaxID=2633591 RepID=UPI00364FF2F8
MGVAAVQELVGQGGGPPVAGETGGKDEEVEGNPGLAGAAEGLIAGESILQEVDGPHEIVLEQRAEPGRTARRGEGAGVLRGPGQVGALGHSNLAAGRIAGEEGQPSVQRALALTGLGSVFSASSCARKPRSSSRGPMPSRWLRTDVMISRPLRASPG